MVSPFPSNVGGVTIYYSSFEKKACLLAQKLWRGKKPLTWILHVWVIESNQSKQTHTTVGLATYILPDLALNINMSVNMCSIYVYTAVCSVMHYYCCIRLGQYAAPSRDVDPLAVHVGLTWYNAMPSPVETSGRWSSWASASTTSRYARTPTTIGIACGSTSPSRTSALSSRYARTYQVYAWKNQHTWCKRSSVYFISLDRKSVWFILQLARVARCL